VDAVGGWLPLILLGLLFSVTVAYWRMASAGLPPGPWGLPGLGFLLSIDSKAPYETFSNLAQRYGSVYSLRLGGLLTVFVSDPQLIRRAFGQDVFSGRAPLYLTHGIMQGHGLICSEGAVWKEHRRFVIGVMKQLGMGRSGDGRQLMEARIMDRVIDYLQSLENHVEDAWIDPVPQLRHCIGNIINGVVFGRTYNIDDPEWIYLQHLLDEGIKKVAVAGPLNFLPILRFLPQFRDSMSFVLDGKAKTHTIYRRIIGDHKDIHHDEYRDVIEAYLIEMKRRGEGHLDTFTESQLLHVLADLFGAGTDTSMTIIKWVLLYMILYPDLQTQVQEEVDAVIGSGRYASISDMEHLPVTEAVIQEVQRLRTILPLGVPHGTTHDCELGGYRIPKKTMIVPLFWAMNLDPQLWDDPHTFRPERFLDADRKLRKCDNFMPFQTGKRMCIGADLGRITVFLFTVSVLQRFRLDFPPGFNFDTNQKPDYGFTLVPPPYRIRVKRRSL